MEISYPLGFGVKVTYTRNFDVYMYIHMTIGSRTLIPRLTNVFVTAVKQ